MSYRLRRVFFLVLLWAIVCCFYAAASTLRQTPVGRLNPPPRRFRDGKNETVQIETTVGTTSLKEENYSEVKKENLSHVTGDNTGVTEAPSSSERRRRLPDWLTGNQQRDTSEDTERRREATVSKNETRTSRTNATRTSGRFWPAENGFRKTNHDDEQPVDVRRQDDSRETVDVMDQPIPSKEDKSEKRQKREERGWKHWLQKQKEKEISILKDAQRKDTTPLETDANEPITISKEPVVSMQDTEPKEKAVDTTKSESPLKFESPSLDLLRNLRNRFRQHPESSGERQVMQSERKLLEQRKEERIESESLELQPVPIETDGPSKATQSSESKATDTENQVERTTPFVAKLRESASNAKSFLRQLPWQPLQQDNTTVVANTGEAEPVLESASSSVKTDVPETRTDFESMPAESNSQEITTLSNEESQLFDEQSIEEKKVISSAGPLFTRLKESAANTTTFLHGLIPQRNAKERKYVAEQTNKTTVGARNPSNPIDVIRNLPWTPEGGAKYASQPTPVKVNPIQFFRGLPWTPRKISESFLEPAESDGRQVVPLQHEEEGISLQGISSGQGDKVSIDEGALEKAGSEEKMSTGDERQNGTPRFNANELVEHHQFAKKNHSIVVPDVVEEGSDMMAIEIDEALSDYLSRQKEESESDDKEEIAAEENVNVNDSTNVQPKIEEKTALAEIAEEAGEKSHKSDNSDVTNGKESSLSHRPAEENNGDTDNANSYRLDSLVRRVLGSMEEEQKSIEARRNHGHDEAADSSTSDEVDEESQQPSDPSTEDSVLASNRTATPADTDQASPQEQKDERRGQQPPQPQQQPTTVIIMGGPQDGRSTVPGDLTRRPVPTTSLVLIEALVTILGTAIRIWMISFLARWLSEEETLRPVQHFVWERLNDRYMRDAAVLQNVLQLPPTGVPEWRWRRYLRKQHRVEGKASMKQQSLPPQTFARTVIVLNIDSEMTIPHLEQAVTFILSQHREQAFGNIGGLAKELEVILLVDSPGGSVQDFGLASAQVRRLAQEAGVTTTVCVDQIAASGGYMIASQADRIFASAFAIVGSIGVIREGINIQDALERYGIKGIVLKAGDSKVPLTMLGSVTKSDLAKAQNTLDLMHSAFKEFVVSGRPKLGGNIEEVANGDIFFGENAMELSLIDRIVTSEEYLLERVQAGDRVMKLHRAHQYIGRRKLFQPLDLLREKGSPLRAACSRWMKSDVESKLSRIVTATSLAGAIQFLSSRHRFFFGGGFRPR